MKSTQSYLRSKMYENNLRNCYLSSLALLPNFSSFSPLATRKGLLVSNKNTVDVSSQMPGSSRFFCGVAFFSTINFCLLLLISVIFIPVFVNASSYNNSITKDQEVSFSTEFKAELLYWKFYQSLRNYINTGLGITNTIPAHEIPVTESGTRFAGNYQFDPGLRVGVDFRFGAGKAYDLKARYTWYHTINNDSVNRNNDLVGSMNPIAWFLAIGGNGNPISIATMATNLTFQWLDLQAGYQFKKGHFYIRPYSGLTGYMNTGRLKVRYNFLELSSTSLFKNQNIEETFFAKETFLGIGFLNGLDCSWNLNRHWSAWGQFDIKMLYFREFAKGKEIFKSLNNGTQLDILRGKVQYDRTCFFYEFDLGPKWDYWFNRGRYHLCLSAGWNWIISSGGMLGFLGRSNVELGYFVHLQGMNISGLFEF